MKRFIDWLAEPIECPWWAVLAFLLVLSIFGSAVVKWFELTEQSIMELQLRDVIH